MKVEQSAFNRYASELHLNNLMSKGDLARAIGSFDAKGDGFINDLSLLAQCIRAALSRKQFRLCEHTNKVFARIHGSVLPRFLGGALRKVFSDSGDLLDNPCLETEAQLLMFCDSLKRTDPSTKRRPLLEAKLWSGLTERFSTAAEDARAFEARFQSDQEFREFAKRVRVRFRSVLGRANLGKPEFGIGPGKNLDRLEACTGSDWHSVYPTHYGPVSRPIVSAVVRQFNRDPFKPTKRRRYSYTSRYSGGYRLCKPDSTMRCSAQPKSNKALRGVGVMHALRMSAQLSLQRIYYRDCLDEHQPLRDQDAMKANLQDNWNDVGTLDLSNASDYLRWYLLYWLGHGVPWFDAAYELRTETLELPTGVISCTAPVMGEAITFPLLTAVLHAIALSVCDEMGGGHEFVRVYGDDIQTKWFEETARRLEQFGFKVSLEKSYPPSSHFKESCEAHYVEHAGRLRACRPVFLPSAKFNRRNKLNHKDAYRLLVLAKEAYLRNAPLSKALTSVVVERTNLVLPTVVWNTPYLGIPSMSKASHGRVDIVTEDEEEFVLSPRGAVRKHLRSIGTETENCLKVTKKRNFIMTVRTLKKLVVRDTLLDLENQIFVKIGEFHNEIEVNKLRKRGLSDQDIRSWVQSTLSEEDIVAGIQLLIQYVRTMKLG